MGRIHQPQQQYKVACRLARKEIYLGRKDIRHRDLLLRAVLSDRNNAVAVLFWRGSGRHGSLVRMLGFFVCCLPRRVVHLLRRVVEILK